jgi:hypothetical protein
MLALANVLGAFAWDPQIRGFVIVLTSVVILVGSVYLLLATNVGAKLGFLLAFAGLTGWCAVMGWIWVVYGIGIKGHEPHWVPKEIVMGDLREGSALSPTKTFPSRWEQLEEGDPILGDAAATADKVLVPQDTAGGHGAGGGAETEELNVPPPFEESADYIVVGGYRTGGEDYFLPGGGLERNDGFFRGWLHQPHYAVIQVRPVVPVPETDGVPAAPQPDSTKPIVNVVMLRDLGNLRQPSALFAFAFTLLFAVTCLALHRRDQQVAAARAARTAAPATAG